MVLPSYTCALVLMSCTSPFTMLVMKQGGMAIQPASGEINRDCAITCLAH